MVTIKIIVGSTRPNRFALQPANWIQKLGLQSAEDATFEIVDIADAGLPLFDESNMPSKQNYTNEHTKAWSKTIDSADGFIFVSPEYNHSYAPALKNAIDYLVREWEYKPVAFVSYGAEAGGTRGVEHLRSALAWLKMYDLSEQVMIPNYFHRLDEQGNYLFSENEERQAKSLITQIVFWAEQMKHARRKLAAKA